MPAFPLPDGVKGMAARDEDWAAWVARLPSLVDELVDEWALTVHGTPMHGYTSLVVPVDQDGTWAVLKITFAGDRESQHEHLALRQWDGHGAVRLLAADPHRRALLLERIGPDDLRDLWDVEACEVVAGLYGALHRPALPQLERLTTYMTRWLDDVERLGRDLPVPPRMREQALHLGRALCGDEASTGVTVHGDLHYFNVLSSDRGWLAIDPKPMSGDPHYEVPPMLWNRWEEMTGDLRTGIRRRFHTVVDAAALDEARARDWAIVRMVVDVGWSATDAQRQGRRLTKDERERVSQCVAIVKAVQD